MQFINLSLTERQVHNEVKFKYTTDSTPCLPLPFLCVCGSRSGSKRARIVSGSKRARIESEEQEVGQRARGLGQRTKEWVRESEDWFHRIKEWVKDSEDWVRGSRSGSARKIVK